MRYIDLVNRLLQTIRPGLTFSVRTQDACGAQLNAVADLPIHNYLENFYHWACWRRPVGCTCSGCRWHRKLSDVGYMGMIGIRYPQSLIECSNRYLLWEADIINLVTTVGKNDLLTQYFKGSAYTAAWFVGAVDGAVAPTYAAADTMASHAGWTENVGYSNANRITWTGGTASAGSIDNSASPAVFNVNATGTWAGGFLVSNSTKSGTTGILYGEGNYTQGNRGVVSGDTVNVTVTLTAA